MTDAPRHNAHSRSARYWNATAEVYQHETRISTMDYHFGPLLPGDRELKILPPISNGMRCMEIGCGAAQNSIYLARMGARAMGIDASEKQIEAGHGLAREAGVEVELTVGDMDAWTGDGVAPFDLIHTSSLTFSEMPAVVVKRCAEALAPGGRFLLIGLHPLQAGEWTEWDDGAEGVFLTNYLHPPSEEREGGAEHDGILSRHYPLSDMARWLTDAGLGVVRLEEPAPLPIPEMAEEEIRDRVPYESPAWRDLYPFLSAAPPVVIFVSQRLPEA